MPGTQLEGFHLSPQQKRIWGLQESEPVTPYRAHCVVAINGQLDIQLLRAAIQDTINRHEILRTTFHRSPSLSFPLQIIAPEMTHHFTYHDMDKVPLQDRERFKLDLTERACNAEINVEAGPLFKQSLLSLSPTSHVLILTLAAMCCDAASLDNLFKEITNSYAARKRSETFTPDAMQYADLAEWQNELLVAEETQAGRDYWEKQYLSDPLSPRLQIEKEPTGEPYFHPNILLTRFESEVAGYIDRIAGEFETSPSCVLLACWQALLRRAALTDDLTIYAAFDGRKWEETECALGLFARYLPARCRIDGSMKFSDLLEETDKVVNAIHTWQEYFTWDHLGPDFNPICFDYHERQAPFVLDDVSFSITDQYACIDRFKLKLSCIRQERGLISEFHFDKRYFSEAMIARLASQFHTILGSIIANPVCAIGELDIVSEEESDYLIQEFNGARGDYSINECVHKLFEEQVALHSDNTAVVFEQEQITYGELNTKANRLGRYLQHAGVVPDSVVGLHLDRSIEMILGMIGILKAGGAYVVLDPALPKERLRFILDDTRSSLVVTRESLSEAFSDHQARAICLDRDWKFIAEESPDEPVSDVRPENLVYVIYTSGSTGVPKGVAVEHRQLLNYLNGAIERLEILPQSSFATVSTFAADLGNTAIYPALCTGGCLHIVSQQRAYDPLALGDYISANSIDCLKIVPSHLKALLTGENPHRLIPRKRLVLGGEACDAAFVADLKQLAPHCLIFNHYGPTETTVGVLAHRIEDEEADAASQAVPLGRPLRNVSVYILNRFLKPEPIGYRGELCISGGSVTRGYLNRPDLTAESFLPDPFSPEPGARLYKTGDMVRFLYGGSIEFLGRNDDQVKVRGFRIEPGEVEAAIRRHEAIRDAVVIVKNQEGEKRLVACVVLNQPHSQAASDIADSLRAKLPEYMIPCAILLFDRLPLNKNGKVDRQALLQIAPAEHETEKGYAAPRTPVEKRLAEVWTSVLGISRVGIHDNFFELGGDSIIGIRLVARARQAGILLAPGHLFQYPTIAELASLQGSGTEIESDQRTVTGLLPLTPIQHWFFQQNLPDPHHFNQTFLFEATEMLDLDALKKAVEKLLSHHDALRMSFRRESDGWVQRNEAEVKETPVSIVDLSRISDEELKEEIERRAEQAQRGLRLSEGEMIRVEVYECGEGRRSRVLIAIHHLVVDGVSWRILLEDMERGYREARRGEEIGLGAKTASFKQWAEGLKQYAQSSRVVEEMDYWLGEIGSEPSQLPVDYLNGANTRDMAYNLVSSLSVDETEALLREVPGIYKTQINDVLLTSLLHAVSDWTGEDSVLVEIEGHGREPVLQGVDLSRTVGWFTTRFPLRLCRARESDLWETLDAVKQQLRRVPNNGIGYGLLCFLNDDEKIREKLLTLSKPQVSFNYLGQFGRADEEVALFTPASESVGRSRSPAGTMPHLLEVNAAIFGGQLRLDWAYSAGLYRRETIERVMQSFNTSLCSIINERPALKHKSFIAANPPLTNLSPQQLESLINKITKR